MTRYLVYKSAFPDLPKLFPNDPDAQMLPEDVLKDLAEMGKQYFPYEPETYWRDEPEEEMGCGFERSVGELLLTAPCEHVLTAVLRG